MQAADLADIDWTAPWLAPYREVGQALCLEDDWRSAMNRLASERALRNFRGQPIQFIPQEALPPGVPYEAHIGSTGQVPTRDNLHDFFNGLVWLHFPLTKARLNQLQFEQLRGLSETPDGQYRVGNARGRVRDAATIFDENGALLVCQAAELADSLRAHEWIRVFVERRSEFVTTCHVILFGHALMEKLVKPYAAITAHWLRVDVTSAEPVDLDHSTQSLFAADLSTASFSPLPVLGVPGWWPDQGADFYSNSHIFRPKRQNS